MTGEPDLLHAAFVEARRLGHHWVGGEHVLLALAREAAGTPVADALAICGVTASAVEARLAGDRSWPRGPDPAGGILPSPLVHDVLGCARGFAAAAGLDAPRPQHVLLALAWAPCGRHAEALLELAVSAAMVQAALAATGMAVPAIDPPPFRLTSDFGESVDVPERELRPLLDLVSPLLWPPETTVAVRRNDGRASVRAGKAIDLPTQLERLRSKPHESA